MPPIVLHSVRRKSPVSSEWILSCSLPFPFFFSQCFNGDCPALLGTCAWSCSFSLVENSVRQCGGTSISTMILWIWFLMLSHSSVVKKCSRTRKPSSWNWKRWGDYFPPEHSGEAAQSKRKTVLSLCCASAQCENQPNSSPAAVQHAFKFQFQKGFLL